MVQITLVDIAESEKICEAADVIRQPWLRDEGFISIRVNEPDWDVNYSGLEPILTVREGFSGKESVLIFASHSSIMLPAMNELVLEMYEALDCLSRCIRPNSKMDEVSLAFRRRDSYHKARRLVERMEG